MSPSFGMRSVIILLLVLVLLAQPLAAVDRPAAIGGNLRILADLWETLVGLLSRSVNMDLMGPAASQENGSTLDQNGTTMTQDCERGSIMDPNGCPHQ